MAPARHRFESLDTRQTLAEGLAEYFDANPTLKLASIFGTTGGFGILRGYVHHESLDIYGRLPVMDTVRAILASPFLMLRTVWCCRALSTRWPWDRHEAFLDVPLRELRSQFRIRIAHEPSRA